jgi:hypothetical protein
MSARHSATTSGRSSADPLRDPDLGWRPFGYSKRKTKSLIGLAAALIEELTAQIVQQQSAQTATEARLVEITVEAEETRAKLEAAHAELADVRAEKAKRTPNEVEPAMISAALISAQQKAAEIVARARHTAEEMLAAARSDSTSIEEEANHVIEQAEIRAHSLVEQAAQEAESLRAESEQWSARIERERQLWTRFLHRALDAAGQAAALQEHDDAAERPMDVEGEQPHPEVEKDDRVVEEKDLEGDLYDAIKGTDEP